MTADLVTAIVDLNEQEAIAIAKKRLDDGEDPVRILEDSRNAMAIVGKRFEEGDYFVPDLVFSGEILRAIAEITKPKLGGATKTKHRGKIVIGTVAGDIHDIGKNIVTFMLDINGFEVYDLGIDIPAQDFIPKIIESDARIVALSGLLTLAFESMKKTIEAIEIAGLRDKVKIMIGGGQINEDVRKYTKADAYGSNAMEAVSLANKWVGESD